MVNCARNSTKKKAANAALIAYKGYPDGLTSVPVLSATWRTDPFKNVVLALDVPIMLSPTANQTM